MIDLTTDAEKPFIIRTIVGERVFNHYVPMATIDECNDAIEHSKKVRAIERDRRTKERETPEFQESARQIMEQLGHDMMKDRETDVRHVICRIRYEEVDADSVCDAETPAVGSAIDWKSGVEAHHPDGRVRDIVLWQANAGGSTGRTHWCLTQDGRTFGDGEVFGGGFWVSDDGVLKDHADWRIRNVKESESEIPAD